MKYWVHRLLLILRESLAGLGMTPERDPQVVAKNLLMNESVPDLLIDGTERRRQRQKDVQKQTEYYSG